MKILSWANVGVTVMCLAFSPRGAADAEIICDGAPNSVGAGAGIRWAGALQLAQGSIRVEGLPAFTNGMMLYGLSPDSTPFGNGTSCIGGPRWILARKASDGQGRVQLDISAEGEADDVLWLAQFDTWFFQYWYRDAAAGGSAHNLSAAMRVTYQ